MIHGAAWMALGQAVAAAGCARAAAGYPRGPLRTAWRALAALLVLLAVASVTQPEQVLVPALRTLARAAGWYEWRRPLQVAALLAAAVATVGALRGLRCWPAALRGATLAAGLALAVVVLRLVSLHFTDRVLDLPLPGASLGRWLEALALAGLAVALCRAPREAVRLSWKGN